MSEPVVRNGVNLTNIGQLVEAVKANNELANVRFMGKSTWQGSTKAKVTVSQWTAGGGVASRPGREFDINVDEPAQLGGPDTAPNPMELLVAGLCGCLTAGMVTNAALFEVDLSKLEVQVDFDINLMGILGLDKSAHCGANKIHYTVKMAGPGDPAKLKRVKETIDRKSAARNTLEHPVKITSELHLEGS